MNAVDIDGQLEAQVETLPVASNRSVPEAHIHHPCVSLNTAGLRWHLHRYIVKAPWYIEVVMRTCFEINQHATTYPRTDKSVPHTALCCTMFMRPVVATDGWARTS